MPTSSPSARLPAWDVILADGSTARVRPVSPDDIPGYGAARPPVKRDGAICAISVLTRTYLKASWPASSKRKALNIWPW